MFCFGPMREVTNNRKPSSHPPIWTWGTFHGSSCLLPSRLCGGKGTEVTFPHFFHDNIHLFPVHEYADCNNPIFSYFKKNYFENNICVSHSLQFVKFKDLAKKTIEYVMILNLMQMYCVYTQQVSLIQRHLKCLNAFTKGPSWVFLHLSSGLY